MELILDQNFQTIMKFQFRPTHWFLPVIVFINIMTGISIRTLEILPICFGNNDYVAVIRYMQCKKEDFRYSIEDGQAVINTRSG